MRDAVGSTWIFSLVISFTLIFAGFLVLALAYSKAYKLKNEMISIFEKYEGFTKTAYTINQENESYNQRLGSIGIVNQYLNNSGYKSKGVCEIGDYGASDLSDIDGALTYITSESDAKEKYYYCITVGETVGCNTTLKVKVFYDFNLPIFGQLKKYSITGQTREIYRIYINGERSNCNL